MDWSRRRLLQLSVAGALSGCATKSLDGEGFDLPQGGFYQDVGDIRMYCEVRGRGPLLVLQTGLWIRNSATPENEVFSALSEHFTVLTFDGRGQGRTTLGNGPTNYGRFAADTVRLLDALKIESAHFFGHSDGGCIELELLLNFEDRVKSATLAGTAYNHQDGYRPALREHFAKLFQNVNDDIDESSVDGAHLEKLRKSYNENSSHPELFLRILKERTRCWTTEPDFSLKRLSVIRRPVLVLCSGADEYIPKEAMETLANTIPKAQRVYLPKTTHDLRPQMREIAQAIVLFTAGVDANN